MEKQVGKIGHPFFEQYISDRCGFRRTEVSAGPQFGVDVAIVDLPGNLAMALTSDPLSLIPSLGLQESAWLSVHLMANDMATTGFAPMYGQFVLNLPASFSKADFNNYWQYIHQFCKDLKINITGGHTGFIEGQNSTIAGGGTFVTIAPKNEILLSKYAKPGDAILVTKTCAMSASAILAKSFPETVKNKTGIDFYQQACESFYHTSSLKDALIASELNKQTKNVHAMHDVTEGGVLGAIYELAKASGNGAIIYDDKIPIGEIQQAVCDIFGLDPRACVGAGSMIVSCNKKVANSVIAHLFEQGIACKEVGELTNEHKDILLIDKKGHATPLNYQAEDPYWGAFFTALNKGWR